VLTRKNARASLLGNLPRINQRREIKADNIHLQFDSIVVLNHGANNCIFNLPVMQIHADFVADLKFARILWILGHVENVPQNGPS